MAKLSSNFHMQSSSSTVVVPSPLPQSNRIGFWLLQISAKNFRKLNPPASKGALRPRGKATQGAVPALASGPYNTQHRAHREVSRYFRRIVQTRRNVRPAVVEIASKSYVLIFPASLQNDSTRVFCWRFFDRDIKETVVVSQMLPVGFRFASASCSIKTRPGAKDVTLIVSDRPASAAGVYTQNQVVAAP